MARKVDEKATKQRKKEILDAALYCFGKKGFHKSTMQDICAKVGLSPGTVYHYFKSKEEMILHFVEEELRETEEFVDMLNQTTTVEEAVSVMVDSIMEISDFEDAQVYLEVLCEGGRNRKVGKLLDKADNMALKALEKKLKQFRKDLPDTPKDTSVTTLALFIGGQIENLEFFKRYKPSAKECVAMAEICKKSITHAIHHL